MFRYKPPGAGAFEETKVLPSFWMTGKARWVSVLLGGVFSGHEGLENLRATEAGFVACLRGFVRDVSWLDLSPASVGCLTQRISRSTLCCNALNQIFTKNLLVKEIDRMSIYCS